jgi:hypothetical protein
MTVLEQVYASGGDVIIPTLELSCDAWPEPILITHGFEDQTVTDEAGRTLTFIAAGVDISLPKKTNNGTQNLNFAIDNITGEAQRKVDDALAAQARVMLTYREFLASDKTTPAQTPYRFVVRSGQMVGTSVQITAGFFDAINTAWPRDLYTSEFSPGIKYL